jgi:hypothetical protein
MGCSQSSANKNVIAPAKKTSKEVVDTTQKAIANPEQTQTAKNPQFSNSNSDASDSQNSFSDFEEIENDLEMTVYDEEEEGAYGEVWLNKATLRDFMDDSDRCPYEHEFSFDMSEEEANTSFKNDVLVVKKKALGSAVGKEEGVSSQIGTMCSPNFEPQVSNSKKFFIKSVKKKEGGWSRTDLGNRDSHPLTPAMRIMRSKNVKTKSTPAQHILIPNERGSAFDF